MSKLVVCCFLLFVPVSVLAQSSPRTVSEVHVTTPKPGMSAQWEAGRKAHSAFHAAQKDTWPIFTWQIMTGERSGSDITGTPRRHSSGYDTRPTRLLNYTADISEKP